MLWFINRGTAEADIWEEIDLSPLVNPKKNRPILSKSDTISVSNLCSAFLMIKTGFKAPYKLL